MTGQHHYDQILFVREHISDAPRPINTVKIYNRDGEEVSVARFFRIIFAGGASARFHRPAFRDDTDAQEKPNNTLLSERAENEAYCMATPGKQYAVYFPDGGTVKLDVSAADGPLEARWLDIDRSAWQDAQTANGGGQLELKAPRQGQWAVLVLAR